MVLTSLKYSLEYSAGMSREETVARCQFLGWPIQGDFIKPVKSKAVMPTLLNADELQALTGMRRGV